MSLSNVLYLAICLSMVTMVTVASPAHKLYLVKMANGQTKLIKTGPKHAKDAAKASVVDYKYNELDLDWMEPRNPKIVRRFTKTNMK